MRTLIILLSFTTHSVEKVKAVFYWIESARLLQLGQGFLPFKNDRKANMDKTETRQIKLFGFPRVSGPWFDLKSLLLKLVTIKRFLATGFMRQREKTIARNLKRKGTCVLFLNKQIFKIMTVVINKFILHYICVYTYFNLI